MQECRAILASIGHAVKCLTDRVAVEFGREDLQAAFVAFDLDTWSRGTASARSTPVDASMIDARYSLTELRDVAVRLCQASLGINDGVGPEWVRMVQLALDERERMRAGSRRTLAEYVRTAA